MLFIIKNKIGNKILSVNTVFDNIRIPRFMLILFVIRIPAVKNLG